MFSFSNTIRMIRSRGLRWTENVARMGRKRMHIGFWWENQKERYQYATTTHRWEDNTSIKIDLREIGWGGMDWINLAQDGDPWRAFLNTVMNLRLS
jgi:hypothetical protein